MSYCCDSGDVFLKVAVLVHIRRGNKVPSDAGLCQQTISEKREVRKNYVVLNAQRE
jgi:hypothetical protein